MRGQSHPVSHSDQMLVTAQCSRASSPSSWVVRSVCLLGSCHPDGRTDPVLIVIEIHQFDSWPRGISLTTEKEHNTGWEEPPGGTREQGGTLFLPCHVPSYHPFRGLHVTKHVKYLPGCLAQSRALINESSDCHHHRICDLSHYSLPPSDGQGFFPGRDGTEVMGGAVHT